MVKCKRLVYRSGDSKKATILLGLIESEDDYFVKFRTNKNTYTLAKSTILSIGDTQEEFKELKP